MSKQKLDSDLIRVKIKLKEEIEDIRAQREQLGLSKLSYTKITSLIPRHKVWDNIKFDIINYMGFDDE